MAPKYQWVETKLQISRRIRAAEQKAPSFRTKEFLKLQKEWYKKLKQSGFEDLEFFGENGEPTHNMLNQSLANIRKTYSPQSFYYFNRAGWFLHHGWFLDKLEHDIWELHCEGLSNYQIGLKFGRGREAIRARVTRVRKRMMLDKRYDQIESTYIANKVRRFNYIVSKITNKKS